MSVNAFAIMQLNAVRLVLHSVIFFIEYDYITNHRSALRVGNKYETFCATAGQHMYFTWTKMNNNLLSNCLTVILTAVR